MAEQWYLLQDGQQLGPFSWEDLYDKAVSRTLKQDDMVWNQNMSEWARIDSIPELLPHQSAAPPPPLHVSQNTMNQQQHNLTPPPQGGGSQLPPRGSYSKSTQQNYQTGPFADEKKGSQGCFIFLFIIIALLVIGLGIAYYFLS